MRKFIKTVFFFSFISIITYIILLQIWGCFLPRRFQGNLHYNSEGKGIMFTYKRFEEAQKTKNVDILFIGSSHANRGFDPRIFRKAGYKTFNLGTGAQTPLQTLYLLKRFSQELNPKLLIFEVSPILFTFDGVESSLDIISNDNNYNIEKLQMIIDQNHLKVYNTFLFSYFQHNLFNKVNNKDTVIGIHKYIPGGYIEKELQFFENKNHPPKKWQFKKLQWKAFENIIKYTRKKNITLILIQAPITSSLYNSHLNNSIFNTKMINSGEYYNFNNLINLNDSLHFYDEHHLNQNGVKIFNNSLLKVLESKKYQKIISAPKD